MALTATTLAATSIGDTSAVLNGELSGFTSSTFGSGTYGSGLFGGTAIDYHFEYGLTAAYGSSTATLQAFEPTPVAAFISGLSPLTLYHFRLVATDGVTTSNGSDLTFTTSVTLSYALNELPKSMLTILITHQDGYVTRLGADEPDSAWIPQGVQWTSVLPGGWKDASFSLRRRIDEDVPLRLLDEVEIIDENGTTMYQGRIVKLPRQHGDDFLLGVECLGWSAHLLDDPTVPFFFVDRDMGGWGAPSLARRVSHGALPLDTDYQASADGGFVRFEGPADVAGGRTILQNSTALLNYKAPVGTTVTKLMYRGTEANVATNGNSLEVARVIADDNDAMSSPTGYTMTLDDTLRTVTITTPERYLEMRALATANNTPTAAFGRRLSKLGIYGNHGLTSVSWSATEPDGYYIDDMLAWALSRGAPKLHYSTGEGGSIERPPVIVPHASDGSLGTADRIVLDLNKYVLWDWLVYDGPNGPTFYYRPPDPDRLTWEARLDQGVFLNLEGDDSERAVNGLVVSYTDGAGVSKVAGPTGSGLDYESDLLTDTDPEGTVNAHGYSRKWAEMSISTPLGDDSYAAVIGGAYLAQTQLPSRSGDMTLPARVGHPTKGDRPAREVRAGDWIQVSDHPSDVPRRIISCTYNDDARTTSVSVGNDLNKVDAILEQLGIFTATVGQ